MVTTLYLLMTVAICRRSFLTPWIRTVSGGLVAGGFEDH